MPAYGTFTYGSATYGSGAVGVSTIITLTEAKAFLNKSSTADDGEIIDLLLVVSEICERFTRKTWRSATVTETHSTCDSDYLHLRRVPVTSVTSVVVNGVTVTDYVVDKRAGLIRRGTTISEYDWEDSFAGITVTYVTGPASVPEYIKQGCLLLLRHMWDTQRGGSGGPRQNGAVDEYDPALGFYIPNRVRQAWGEPRVLVR